MGLFSHDAADDVVVSATFPESNPFGLIMNGEQNAMQIHLSNTGKKNYTLVSAAASYHDPAKNWALIKNQTALRFNVPLVSGANFSAPFNVYSEYRPSELGLTVWVNIAEPPSRDLIPITAFNQTVSVVESPTGWFDPSLLLAYALILGSLAAAGWFAFQAYTGQSTKKGKRTTVKKAVVPAPQDKQVYPDVKPYEEDWIPAHHLKSDKSKLKKRGTGGASSAGEELTSGGEFTSGGELSGTEGKKGKRKTKKA